MTKNDLPVRSLIESSRKSTQTGNTRLERVVSKCVRGTPSRPRQGLRIGTSLR